MHCCRAVIVAAVAAGLLALGVACATASPPLTDTIRAPSCANHTETQTALRPNARLDQAAARLARGSRLAAALEDVSYRAERSISIKVVERREDSDPHFLLRRQVCAALVDTRLSEFGLFEHDREVWVVLAAPFTPPRAGDATAVSVRVLELTNQARGKPRRCGLESLPAAPPLKLNPILQRVALAHAQDMAAQTRMTHRGSDGSMPADRATRAGYKWRAVGENIAAGAPNPEQLVQSWLDSPGHCGNLMSPDFTEMGLAYAAAAAGEMGIYWAQALARPR